MFFSSLPEVSTGLVPLLNATKVKYTKVDNKYKYLITEIDFTANTKRAQRKSESGLGHDDGKFSLVASASSHSVPCL